MPELHDPLSPAVRRTLRRAVLDHATSEHRTRFRPLLHVGTPGTAHLVVPALAEPGEGPHDHAVRVDVMAALLHACPAGAPGAPGAPGPGSGAPLVWLTRSGDATLQDVDVAWLAAARAAAAEADVDLTMVVVDRHGWRDPRTGAGVRWRRLRERST